MRINVRLIIVLVGVAMTSLMEVESRRHKQHSGKVAADAMMRSWQHMLKQWQGPTYKYWHHRRDSDGNWHTRKYGHSDSYSSSGSDSTSSESGSKSSSKSGSSSKSSSSSREHHGHGHRRRLLDSSESKVEKMGIYPATEAFILYGTGYGCKNVTAYQHFLASYTTGEGRPANLGGSEIREKEKNELLKEMSKLAAADLAKDANAGNEEDVSQQCSETCPTSESTTENAESETDATEGPEENK